LKINFSDNISENALSQNDYDSFKKEIQRREHIKERRADYDFLLKIFQKFCEALIG